MPLTQTHETASTRFIVANGIRYAYRRFGAPAGTPLLLLQHFRGGLDHWDPAVTDGLAQDRPVILFNNAGVASSEGEPSGTVGGMAEHVAAFLGALGLGEIDLLGFSMGGFVAQQLVIDHPDLVRRLILAGTGPQGGEDMAEYPAEAAAHAMAASPGLDDFLFLFFAPTPTSIEAGKAYWERRHRRADQDVPSSAAAMMAQAAVIAAWGAVPASNRYESLKHITQRTLVVDGKHDIMVPARNSFILQREIPNATLILYPDSGHGALFQYPDDFVAQARRFLANG